MSIQKRIAVLAALIYLGAACAVNRPPTASLHRWWSGLGPVLPHDTFPADCSLCHATGDWQTVRDDFEFDHAAETGVPLAGAHQRARCLHCHNDRGPVEVFSAQGCQGCHTDFHLGQLGPKCLMCHQEETWVPEGQIELHYRTRFPLVGVHASTACRRCHPGALVGRFTPTDIQCVTCHRDDLARAVNPNHIGLGWVDNCDRCHMPTTWNQAELD